MLLLLLLVTVALAIWFCTSKEPLTPGHFWGSCPHHCNCAVYTQDGQWVKCQRARMEGPCKPKHPDRDCRGASTGMGTQFKISCCGASCGKPGMNIGRSIQCTLKNGGWKGHIHTCGYAGEDLRCHK